MPLEVKIPKEIMEYREKIIFGMGIRQLICVLIALVFGIFTFFCAMPLIGSDLAGYLVLAELMPIMGIGFLRINGFTFERYVLIVIMHMIKKPIRVYRTELSVDYFDEYNNFDVSGEAKNELVEMVKKERFANVKDECNPIWWVLQDAKFLVTFIICRSDFVYVFF